MNIGEVAKRSGLNPSRIRFYEAQKLLNLVVRKPNGYRDYPADVILILKIITSAQSAGLSLEEIQAILPADLSTRSMMNSLRDSNVPVPQARRNRWKPP